MKVTMETLKTKNAKTNAKQQHNNALPLWMRQEKRREDKTKACRGKRYIRLSQFLWNETWFLLPTLEAPES